MDKQSANTFRIVTRWRVEATIDEFAAILNDALALPNWWGDVYLGTKIIEPGGKNGIGRKVAVHSKGWLPYHLNWAQRWPSASPRMAGPFRQAAISKAKACGR